MLEASFEVALLDVVPVYRSDVLKGWCFSVFRASVLHQSVMGLIPG